MLMSMKSYTQLMSGFVSWCSVRWQRINNKNAWLSNNDRRGLSSTAHSESFFFWDKVTLKRIGSLEFMNCKAIGNQAYVPTDLEHVANVITHGIWIVPTWYGVISMIEQASNRQQMFNAVVYGLALLALFSISTIFHSVFFLRRFGNLKDVLHRCDRAVIYLFIAASYTPWLTLKEMGPGYCNHVRWLVWLFACFGIIYQQVYHERYKWLETLFYCLLGLLPSIAIFQMPEWTGLYELGVGGIVYIIGIYFFKSDGRIPCAHAIWHLFVVVGSTFHYYAVCTYLMGKNNERQLAENAVITASAAS